MAISLQGKVTGRAKRTNEEGKDIVTLRVADDDGVFLVTWFDPETKKIPKVGENVNLSVKVRVYVDKGGLPRLGLNYDSGGRSFGELF